MDTPGFNGALAEGSHPSLSVDMPFARLAAK
jgi:hypothetical protein